jgi:hypothetical protein
MLIAIFMRGKIFFPRGLFSDFSSLFKRKSMWNFPNRIYVASSREVTWTRSCWVHKLVDLYEFLLP